MTSGQGAVYKCTMYIHVHEVILVGGVPDKLRIFPAKKYETATAQGLQVYWTPPGTGDFAPCWKLV